MEPPCVMGYHVGEKLVSFIFPKVLGSVANGHESRPSSKPLAGVHSIPGNNNKT